jgi:hypothetical protein
MKGLLKQPTRKFKCESIKIFKKNHNNGLENNYNIISKWKIFIELGALAIHDKQRQNMIKSEDATLAKKFTIVNLLLVTNFSAKYTVASSRSRHPRKLQKW